MPVLAEIFKSKEYFQLNEFDPSIQELLDQIHSVNPECVLFNFECCSGVEQSIPFADSVFNLTHVLLDHKFMIKFSDTTARYIIQHWDAQILGTNPFVIKNNYSGKVLYKFDKAQLARSQSNQFRLISSLVTDDCFSINAHEDTLGFTILNSSDKMNLSMIKCKFKNVEILTRVVSIDNEETDLVGDAMLHY